MQPNLRLLSENVVKQIIGEGIALLEDPGLVINHPEALQLLAEFGAKIDFKNEIARVPGELADKALGSCPKQFSLFDLNGEETICYGNDQTYFNPGSSALQVLDSRTEALRPADSSDLALFIKLVEVLPQIDSQSTAMVCSDVPETIQDLYRLYISLNYQTKPVVTGVFTHSNWQVMKDMLNTAVGGSQLLSEKPLAVFDICPTSPLKWGFNNCQNLLDNARSLVPIQIISMPMAGATSPVTLAGTLVQHTAECLSGVILAQLARKGAPVVWGGSPAVFDMKHSTAPMGAAGTWLLAVAYAQIARTLGLPSQAYLGISDAKLVDAQAGMESASGALLGALAGIGMISGAGMLAYQNCQSPEKLVLDAEWIGQIRQFLKGIQLREDPLGLDQIRTVGHQGDFISQDHTFRWFKEETHIPSPLIDRLILSDWVKKGSRDAWQRARQTVGELLSEYPGPTLDAATRKELRRITALAASQAGMDRLPVLPD